jgi:hypothetical protein
MMEPVRLVLYSKREISIMNSPDHACQPKNFLANMNALNGNIILGAGFEEISRNGIGPVMKTNSLSKK